MGDSVVYFQKAVILGTRPETRSARTPEALEDVGARPPGAPTSPTGRVTLGTAVSRLPRFRPARGPAPHTSSRVSAQWSHPPEVLGRLQALGPFPGPPTRGSRPERPRLAAAAALLAIAVRAWRCRAAVRAVEPCSREKGETSKEQVSFERASEITQRCERPRRPWAAPRGLGPALSWHRSVQLRPPPGSPSPRGRSHVPLLFARASWSRLSVKLRCK